MLASYYRKIGLLRNVMHHALHTMVSLVILLTASFVH